MVKHVAFMTLGCAKNEVDTAAMQKDLIKNGFDVIDLDHETYDGSFDAVVLNTCAFIQPAIEESIDTILDCAATEDVQTGSTKLIVCGCLPSRFTEHLAEELPEVQVFLPCNREHELVQVLCDELGVEPVAQEAEFYYSPSEYVKISDGCSRRCAFCTIPFIRGPYHSFSRDDIYSDVSQKIAGGAQEIVLIAQDSGIWGQDLSPRTTLATLLENLARAFPDTWFRVMYLQPAGITDELIRVMATYPNICSYLDIPLQHCNTNILRAMNRQGSRSEYEHMVKKLRQAIPDITLRTTLIVGYPGETEEMFDELCDFVSSCEFDYVGIFAFSPEEGTVAADLPDQIDEDTKQYRVRELRDIADTVSSQRIAQRIGSSCEVLVLGVEEDGQVFGRTQAQAPDVDGVTYVDSAFVGQRIYATITDTLLYEMEAVRES